MIIISTTVILVATCVLLERLVKSSLFRIIGVMLIVLFSTVIATNIGMSLGKVDQLNRFSRLLPRVFTVLDQVKGEPESFNEALRVIQVVAGDPVKLDTLDATVAQLEERTGGK